MTGASIDLPPHDLFDRLWSVHLPGLREDVWTQPANSVPLLRELRDWRLLGDDIAHFRLYAAFERIA